LKEEKKMYFLLLLNSSEGILVFSTYKSERKELSVPQILGLVTNSFGYAG
jgi:hypothetical protein